VWLVAGVLLASVGTVAWLAASKGRNPGEAATRDAHTAHVEVGSTVLSESAGSAHDDLAYQPAPGMVREPVSVVTGTVRWPEGDPGEGAEVVMTGTSGVTGARNSDGTWIEHVKEDGAFRIEGLSEGNYLLVVRCIWRGGTDPSGLIGWWLATTRVQMPRADSVDLVLGPMESIRGQVSRRDGQSMDGFDLCAVPKLGEGEFDDGRTPYDWHFGSPDGSFDLTGLLPGTWEFHVEASGFAPVRPKKIEVPHKEPVEFDLVPNVEITGRVVDSTGEHLRAVARAKWSDSGDSIAAGTASDHTWGDGLFRVRVPPTVVELQAFCDGVDSEPIMVDLTRGGSREGLTVVASRKQ
jgi:hypothetical protein